jgi:hypothetical protein
MASLAGAVGAVVLLGGAERAEAATKAYDDGLASKSDAVLPLSAYKVSITQARCVPRCPPGLVVEVAWSMG